MTITEIFLLVAGLALIVITIFLVPVLIQLRRVGEKVEKLVGDLDRELPPLLNNLNDSAAELRILTTSINRKIEEVDKIINVARQASETLVYTVDLFKKTVLPVITKVGGFSAGLLTIFSFLKKSRQNNITEE
ncbi:MAG: DUF948 domain-containing protein [Desulfobulbaceae bacterium]|nr:DUF948 domain-containing protein [Desulfobulbaceae bacterium]